MMATTIVTATTIGVAMVEAVKVAMESGEDRLAIINRNVPSRPSQTLLSHLLTTQLLEEEQRLTGKG